MCTPNPEGFNVSAENCKTCTCVPKVDYICIKCGYKLENGGLMAREMCPKFDGGCGAFDSFILAS